MTALSIPSINIIKKEQKKNRKKTEEIMMYQLSGNAILERFVVGCEEAMPCSTLRGVRLILSTHYTDQGLVILGNYCAA